MLQTPLWEGNADDRKLEAASFHHGIERWEDLLVRQIAGYTEEHQCVRMDRGHHAPTSQSRSRQCAHPLGRLGKEFRSPLLQLACVSVEAADSLGQLVDRHGIFVVQEAVGLLVEVKGRSIAG